MLNGLNQTSFQGNLAFDGNMPLKTSELLRNSSCSENT